MFIDNLFQVRSKRKLINPGLLDHPADSKNSCAAILGQAFSDKPFGSVQDDLRNIGNRLHVIYNCGTLKKPD